MGEGIQQALEIRPDACMVCHRSEMYIAGRRIEVACALDALTETQILTIRLLSWTGPPLCSACIAEEDYEREGMCQWPEVRGHSWPSEDRGANECCGPHAPAIDTHRKGQKVC